MFNQQLAKHVARAFATSSVEVTEDGIIVPGVGRLQGEYTHSVNGGDVRVDKNILTTQFLNYLLMCGLHTQAKIPNWYLSLFSGNVTPATTWTAAQYPAAASELVSSTEGYSQANRPAFAATATSTNQIDNLVGGKAVFTIVTASSLVIRGAALASDQLKGSTSGVLASASRFAQDRTLFDGDSFELGYRVTLNAV